MSNARPTRGMTFRQSVCVWCNGWIVQKRAGGPWLHTADGRLACDDGRHQFNDRIGWRDFPGPPRCACGKPVAHLDADEDSNEWACQMPAAGEAPLGGGFCQVEGCGQTRSADVHRTPGDAPPTDCDCPGCGWGVDCWHPADGHTYAQEFGRWWRVMPDGRRLPVEGPE